MRTKSPDELRHRALKGALGWLATDVAFEFDDQLLAPVRSPDTFFEAARTFACHRFESDESGFAVDPGAPMDTLRRTLTAAGEDVARLSDWIRSFSDWDVMEEGAGYSQACWRGALRSWAEGRIGSPRYADRKRLLHLGVSYAEEVVKPGERFRERAEARDKQWRSDPASRTKHDELMRRELHEDSEYSPASFLALHYSGVLDRRWWRDHRNDLDEDEHAELLAEMVMDVYDRGEADIAKWEYMYTLDRAFDMPDVPDFDDVKRDWAAAGAEASLRDDRDPDPNGTGRHRDS